MELKIHRVSKGKKVKKIVVKVTKSRLGWM